MSHGSEKKSLPRETNEDTDNGIGSKSVKNPKYNKEAEKKCPKCDKIMKTERCICESNSSKQTCNVNQN